MKELTNINFRRYKWRLPALIALLVVVVAGSFWLNTAPFRSGFEITDELGGNIFPSSILSVATTDAQVIVPADSLYVGNSKSCISIRFCPVPYLSLCWLNHGRNIRSIPILSGITKR